MSKASTHSFKLGQAGPSARPIDLCVVIPILACVYATIVTPLIVFASGPSTAEVTLDSGMPNRIFWPAMTAISVILALQNYPRLRTLTIPPHIICLIAYLAFAGASVLWAFKPELSFIRFVQQAMILTSIVLPALLAARKSDLMQGLFLCFAVASILNLIFVFNNSDAIVRVLNGYPGYFPGKNYLGEFAAVAFLLSLHEILYPGRRRLLGIVFVVIAISLLFLANSKTALGLAFLVPCVAGILLVARKVTRISPAVLIISLVLCYVVVSSVSGFTMNRLSYWLYGDSTFTGRTSIWSFANLQIGRRPLLGWGYQSFWLIGPDAPSVLEAPGWIKTMPNAHNGYMDTLLEMGYIGLALLLTFIVATLHAIGRVAARDPARAWILLSLVLYILLYNFLESIWMRGFEMMWVLFVILAAEIGRYWQPAPTVSAAYGSGTPRPAGPGPIEAQGVPNRESR